MTHHVILSGGLDSTVTLATALLKSPDVRAVTINYGQRHVRELDHARAVASHYGVPLEVLDLRGLLHGSALLGEVPVPRQEYEPESMGKTVVHGRNLLFASSAIARASAGDSVWVGVHGGDHHLYPDCRPDFWHPMAELVAAAYQVDVRTPLLYSSKGEVVRQGVALEAPLELTWSCYEGGEKHCGQCGTCVERRAAFAWAGEEDLTIYAETS